MYCSVDTLLEWTMTRHPDYAMVGILQKQNISVVVKLHKKFTVVVGIVQLIWTRVVRYRVKMEVGVKNNHLGTYASAEQGRQGISAK